MRNRKIWRDLRLARRTALLRVTALLCALALLTGCAAEAPAAEQASAEAFVEEMAGALDARGGYRISAAVLYDESAEGFYETTLSWLKQPLLLGLEVCAEEAYGDWSEKGYDVLYLDESLANGRREAALVQQIQDFAAGGGAVFCANALSTLLPPEFFGAQGFVPVNRFPRRIRLPRTDADRTQLQEIVADFHGLYKRFGEYETLQARDYGYAARCPRANMLIKARGLGLCTLSDYGEGCVFLASPLLPNFYMVSSLSMQPDNDEQLPFVPAAASFGRLLLCGFASYAAKRIYGCSLERVFGVYGSPSMAWELHYEEIDAMGNDSLRTFSELCEAKRQIPSYTVVRNPYQWFTQAETVSYLLNQSGRSNELRFEMDLYENAYSSGTHVDSGGAWLRLGDLTDAGSYFEVLPEENLRLFPCACDYDGDGDADLFCGCAGGQVYYYENLGFTGLDGRLRFGEPQQMFGGFTVPFSAPAMLDVDGDGAADLLVGGGDGVLRWYRSEGSLRFSAMGALVKTGQAGQVLPAVGDLDGDGIPELALGSDSGKLTLYHGTRRDGRWTAGEVTALEETEPFRAALDDGYGWVSPSWADTDGDGRMDLVIGCLEGYTTVFRSLGGGEFADGVRVTMDELNYQGNNSVKLGTYLTPLLLDLDGDGDLDLLGGYEEYGMAYPIDSPYFPYREQLQEQLDYCAERGYYVSAHTLTTEYSSPKREQYELSAHQEALRSYGVETQGKGTNQHTWFISALDDTQTFRLMREAGYLWNSGFSPAHSARRNPEGQEENVVALPYYLDDGGSPFLIQSVSVLPHRDVGDTNLSGKYAMPMSVYFHCDLIFRAGPDDYAAVIDTVERFRQKFGYGFVTEDQLAYAIAAAYNLTADVRAENGAVTLTAGAADESLPLYRESYRDACGLRIEVSGRFDAEQITTDAKVLRRGKNALIVGLDGPVKLFGERVPETRLARVNLPAELSLLPDGAEIAFQDGGLMEVFVWGEAVAETPGWAAEAKFGGTVFTKFGAPETLRIRY